MGNYKIKVNTKIESDLVQFLLKLIGYYRPYNTFVLHDGWVCFNGKNEIFCVCNSQTGSEVDDCETINYDQLCTMVALHKKPIDMNKVVDGVRDEAMKLLTDNDQREYLNKLTDGTYKLVVLAGDFSDVEGLIEVPEGAEYMTMPNYYFWRGGYSEHAWSNTHKKWTDNKGESLNDYLKGAWSAKIVWQRHTQPEELPFLSSGYNIDSDKINHDFNPSINDQYAEIEQVRQSAYDKQEGGSHYKKLAIQPMQYALENRLDYAQANVVKYVTRHADKNGKEDLLKAIHNIELMIEHYYPDL